MLLLIFWYYIIGYLSGHQLLLILVFIIHPSTYGVLRILSILYGEIIQWLRVELGLLHRGSEKLMDYNYYNNSINYFDRLDYVSTIIQELLYVGVLEIFIQSNTYLFSLNFRIIFIDYIRSFVY